MLFIYFTASLLLLVFSFFQLSLLYFYVFKRKVQQPSVLFDAIEHLPFVTIQLPIYNERYVVERLIEAVSKIDYPKHLLEIQILDDSTDETSEIIRKIILEKETLPSIVHTKRLNRDGFKAGALAHGLQLSKGEFVAIFDADFVPKPDFLKTTLPYFYGKENAKIALVQSRWGHLNEAQSLFTKLQSMVLDGHFRIEQAGRAAAGFFLNFNGTAGIWRRSSIENAGGWSADTLAEDFDLSYRVQMNGGKLIYLENYETPAELPPTILAFRSQQFRWMKGGAECAKKNLKNILRNSSISLLQKIHASYHLLNSSVFILATLVALLSVPMAWLSDNSSRFRYFFTLIQYIQIGWLVLVSFYWVAVRNRMSVIDFLLRIIPLLCLMSGLIWHNTWAVIEGWLGIKTPFVRTPKWGNASINKYVSTTINGHFYIEILLLFYFSAGIFVGISQANIGLVLYQLLLVLGLGFHLFTMVLTKP